MLVLQCSKVSPIMLNSLKAIHSTKDIEDLQADLDSVSFWSTNWKLFFNENKFVHLRYWAASPDVTPTYTINGRAIGHKTQHKDLGILFTCDLSWSQHYQLITSKAYKTLGLLRRTFTGNSTQAKKLLYISLVRSQLLYCSQLWRPYLIKDIQMLERVQCRATKYILNNNKLSYKSRLEQLHLLPLMYTYELNDLLFFIKSLKSPSPHFDINQYIQFSNHSTRATSAHKLTHSSSFTLHQHSFFSKIIRLWNSVPVIDLSLPTDLIKKHLTIFFWEKFSVNFTLDYPCSFHLVCPCHRCTKLPVTMCLHSLLNYTI